MGISIIDNGKYPSGGDEVNDSLALSDLAALSVAWAQSKRSRVAAIKL
jgi:hypothetical protein